MWWLAIFPAATIIIIVLGFNLLGDGVGNIFNVEGKYGRKDKSIRSQRFVRILYSRKCKTHILEDVSFAVSKGKSVGIVGESGCGKTTTMRAILNVLPSNGNDRKAGDIILRRRRA